MEVIDENSGLLLHHFRLLLNLTVSKQQSEFVEITEDCMRQYLEVYRDLVICEQRLRKQMELKTSSSHELQEQIDEWVNHCDKFMKKISSITYDAYITFRITHQRIYQRWQYTKRHIKEVLLPAIKSISENMERFKCSSTEKFRKEMIEIISTCEETSRDWETVGSMNQIKRLERTIATLNSNATRVLCDGYSTLEREAKTKT